MIKTEGRNWPWGREAFVTPKYLAIIFLQDIIISETIVIRRPSTLLQFVGITITDIC